MASEVSQCVEGQNEIQCQCRENICLVNEYCRYGKCYATDTINICDDKYNQYDITSAACQKFAPGLPFYDVRDIPLREKKIMYYHEPEHNHYTIGDGIKVLLNENPSMVLPIPSDSSTCDNFECNSLRYDELNIESVGREAFANTALGKEQILLMFSDQPHMIGKFSAIKKYDAWYGDEQVTRHSPDVPYFEDVIDTFDFSRWTEIADGFYGNDKLDSLICKSSDPHQINIDGRLGVECSDTPICIDTDGTLPTYERCLCPDKNSLFLGEYNEQLAQQLEYLIEAKQTAEYAKQALENIQCSVCGDAGTLLAMNTKFLEVINHKLDKIHQDIDNAFNDPLRYKNGKYAYSKSPNVCKMEEFCSSDGYGVCLEVPMAQEKRNCDPAKKWPEGTPIVLLHEDYLLNNNSDYFYKCNECDQLSGLCKSDATKLRQKCSGFGTRNADNCFIGDKENGEYVEKKLVEFPNDFFDVISDVHVRQILIESNSTKNALVGDGDVYFNNIQNCFVTIKNYAVRHSLELMDLALTFTEETTTLDWTTINQYIEDNESLETHSASTFIRENINDVGQKDTFSSNIECHNLPVESNQMCLEMPNNQSAKVVCIENYYRNNATKNCEACPDDKPRRTLSDTECQMCLQGEIIINGVCHTCPMGTYLSPAMRLFDGTSRLTECQNCPKGRFALVPGSVSKSGTPCTACPPGTHASEPGSIACNWCEKGFGFTSSTTPCVACSAGRYQDLSELPEDNQFKVQSCKLPPSHLSSRRQLGSSDRFFINSELGMSTCRS